MTITLVLPQPPGYSETFFRSKIKGLQESGHRVVLVTAATDRKFEACQHLQHPKVSKNKLFQVLQMVLVFLGLLPSLNRVINYIQLEKQEGTNFKRILEKLYINATLLKLKTNWLHFGFATMALDRELVAKAIGAKLAVSFRGYDIGVYPLKHPNCYDKLWKNVDQVHSISNYLLRKAYSLGLSKATKYQVICPAVDIGSLKISNDLTENTKKIKLLTIARLHWIKGIDDLIQTAFYLKESKIDFEWQIIGNGDKRHQDRYQYHIFQKNLSDEVVLIGKQSHQETLSLLQQTDIYVQTSLNEGFCNAVLEAQALGKLCIVSDAEGLLENVLNTITGWVVPRYQSLVLAQKIQAVIDLPPTKKEEISHNAMQRVKKDFNLKQQKELFNAFYEK